ncbi:MAG: inositol-3-phosphate synthase, partial [Geminicoccaceae bacterium]
DSSNAAGVLIDLIRIAAIAHRRGMGGFPLAAASCLKSPSCGHETYTQGDLAAAFRSLSDEATLTAAR